MHFSNRFGTESTCGKRHCPSSAIRAPSICPLLLSATVAVGTSNSGEGRQKSQTQNKISRMLSFILCFFIKLYLIDDFNLVLKIITSTFVSLSLTKTRKDGLRQAQCANFLSIYYLEFQVSV